MARRILNIELTDDADNRVAKAVEETGMKKRELISRVLIWFTDQPDSVRSMVLGHVPSEIVPDVARILLERMAAGNDPLGRDSITGRGAVIPPAEELKGKK